MATTRRVSTRPDYPTNEKRRVLVISSSVGQTDRPRRRCATVPWRTVNDSQRFCAVCGRFVLMMTEKFARLRFAVAARLFSSVLGQTKIGASERKTKKSYVPRHYE